MLPALAASSCMLGPNYQRPAVTPAPAFRDVTVTPEQARSIADMPWVDLFKEPELSALVREALDHNLELRGRRSSASRSSGRARRCRGPTSSRSSAAR